MGRIVAIGGGFLETLRPIHKYALDLTEKKNPNVLFVPTAARDNPKYISDFINEFEPLNCNVKILELVNKKYSTREIDSLLDWMDMIYVGGGNTIFMMKLWQEVGLDVKLKTIFANNSAVLAGQGSGCLCWFQCGYSNSRYVDGKSDWQYIWTDNLLNLHHTAVCPHYSAEDRTNFDQRLLESEVPGFALEDNTAFVQTGEHTEFLGCLESAKAYYLIYLNGEMFKKEIPLKYI